MMWGCDEVKRGEVGYRGMENGEVLWYNDIDASSNTDTVVLLLPRVLKIISPVFYVYVPSSYFSLKLTLMYSIFNSQIIIIFFFNFLHILTHLFMAKKRF